MNCKLKSSAADEGEGRFVGAENKTMKSRNLVNQDYRLLRKKIPLFNLNHLGDNTNIFLVLTYSV